MTREFFALLGAELSFSRVRRPTDNARMERFYGTIKQEEMYVVGNYPDLRSAQREIGTYMERYNTRRPHQALWNFTPQMVHDLNNKTEVMGRLRTLKRDTWQRRKEYWHNVEPEMAPHRPCLMKRSLKSATGYGQGRAGCRSTQPHPRTMR